MSENDFRTVNKIENSEAVRQSIRSMLEQPDREFLCISLAKPTDENDDLMGQTERRIVMSSDLSVILVHIDTLLSSLSEELGVSSFCGLITEEKIAILGNGDVVVRMLETLLVASESMGFNENARDAFNDLIVKARAIAVAYRETQKEGQRQMIEG